MQMTPKKRKWIIGGCSGALLLGIVIVIGWVWLIFSPESPINRSYAIEETQKWARLADFPETQRDLQIETSGSMFTRGFRISFRDTPQNIRAWLAVSPGPASVEPTIDSAGWRIYSYRAGDGAVFAEVRVSPSEEEVRIRTYWS